MNITSTQSTNGLQTRVHRRPAAQTEEHTHTEQEDQISFSDRAAGFGNGLATFAVLSAPAALATGLLSGTGTAFGEAVAVTMTGGLGLLCAGTTVGNLLEPGEDIQTGMLMTAGAFVGCAVGLGLNVDPQMALLAAGGLGLGAGALGAIYNLQGDGAE